MSFAQRLSQRSSAVEAQQLASDHQKIQAWVRQAVAAVERQCEQASEKAQRNAITDVKYTHVLKTLQQLPANHWTFQTALQQALGGHGFSTLEMWVSFPVITVKASWSQTAPPDDSSGGHGAGCQQAGLVTTCGICNEDPKVG